MKGEFFIRILKLLIKMFDIGVEKMIEIYILKLFMNKGRGLGG